MNKPYLIIMGIGISIIAVRCASTYHIPGKLPEGCISPIKVDPDFKIPMGPYGLPYRVGNLGGKPVMFGEGFGMAEYCDSPTITGSKGWKHYEHPKRSFDSSLTSLYWEFKYTTGLIYIGYMEAPPQSKIEHEAEAMKPHSRWVTVGVNAGTRYFYRDLHTVFLKYTTDIDIKSQQYLEDSDYRGIVIPTQKKVFHLEEYVAHPEWIKRLERQKIVNKYIRGYQDTFDIYVQKNSQDRVMTMIICNNWPPHTWSYRCDMKWSLEPYMNKVFLEASFSRAHLKDWQIIKQQSEKILKSTVVDPKTFKFIHPYGENNNIEN